MISSFTGQRDYSQVQIESICSQQFQCDTNGENFLLRGIKIVGKRDVSFQVIYF